MSSKSENLFEFSKQCLAGGVASSGNLNAALGRPFYISRGDGAKIYDLEGREYIDMCISHGASILGHHHPKISQAVRKAVEIGSICSYPNEYQSKLAKRLVEIIPCAELVRFSTSGTEATMHALRLARAYTGKEKIIKFEGHMHGFHDYGLWSAFPSLDDDIGPEDTPNPVPRSSGVPKKIKDDIIVLSFNDNDALERTIQKHKDEVAVVIMEPINYNSGCIVPNPSFLKLVRKLTTQNNIVLLFDEVLSAFRTGLGCAQEYLGVTPDLCTIGKAIAGGLPFSLFCGKKEIMQCLSPLGDCLHTGTFNGHLIAVLAALTCLEEMSSPGFFDHINNLAERLYSDTQDIIKRSGVKARVQGVGSQFSLFFGIDQEVTNYRMAAQNDNDMLLKFVKSCWNNGVYFDYHGNAVGHHGISAAHQVEDIDKVLEVIEDVFKGLK